MEIIVGSAASLTDFLIEAKVAFEDKNPHITVAIPSAPGGVPQQQIEQGADVNVFVSAAEPNMNT